jgi:hypothetical protein
MTAFNKTVRVREVKLIDAVEDTVTGDAYQLPQKKTYQISGITTATVNIQASNDGSNWITIATTTANAMYENDDPYVFTRATISAHTTGTISVTASYWDE